MKKLFCFLLFAIPFLIMLLSLFFTNTNEDKKIKEIENIIGEKIENVTIDNEWLNKNNVEYKLSNTFSSCKNIDKLIEKGDLANSIKEIKAISRVEFLEILLKTHCIDFNDVNIENLDNTDLKNSSNKDKKIIQKAVELGIFNGYSKNGKNNFKANKNISKIEALAVMFRLANPELKNKDLKNNFKDLDTDWKKDVANIANKFSITKVDTKNNFFNPEIVITNKSLYNMIVKLVSYYR